MSLALSASSPQYFGRVDALRGLTALAVAAYHFSGCTVNGFTLLSHGPWVGVEPIQSAIGTFVARILPVHVLVTVFFVISGFVLRLSLGNGPRTAPAATARMVITRLFRFFPIVAVGVIVSAMMREESSTRLFVANLLLLDVSMNPHLWSLQVELLMVPVILTLFFLELRKGPGAVLAVTLATTWLAFAPRWAIWPPLSLSVFAFGLGMLIPTYGRQFAQRLSTRGASVAAIGSMATLLAISPTIGAYSRFSDVIGGYAATVLIAIMSYRIDVPVLKWSDARWLRRVGAASGSYYVLHMATVPVMTALAAAVIPAAWSARMPALVGIGVIAFWIAAIALPSIWVARLIEEPGVALGRRVLNSLRLGSQRRTPFQEVAVPRRLAA